MIKLFKKIVDDWKVNEEAVKEQERKDYAEAEKKVETFNILMASSFCPLVNGMCRRTCVHFKGGFVAEFEDSDYTKYYVANKPQCKLWNKR